MRGGSNRPITAKETAEYLRINVDTLYRTWEKKGLKGYRIYGRLMFRARDIESWIERQAI